MFLLDTNVVSELRLAQAGRGSEVVGAWAREQPPGAFFLSAIVLHELEKGVLRLERRDQRQGAALRGWLTRYAIPFFEGRILSVDGAVARAAAAFHVPDPAPFADSLIAATAQVHGLTIATRNTRDFRFPGVPVLNPWEHPLPAAPGGGIS